MNRAKILEQAKPLGMTEENYRKVIARLKWQTRRVCKNSLKHFCDINAKGNAVFTDDEVTYKEISPKYKIDDICYLTEPVQIVDMMLLDNLEGYAYVDYLWESYDKPNANQKYLLGSKELDQINGRKNAFNVPTTSRFMLKPFAREFVRVTDVRVERLQDIQTCDIRAEGVDDGYTNPKMGARHDAGMRMAWGRLWNSIYAKREKGKYAWEANPYVFAYTFERLEV